MMLSDKIKKYSKKALSNPREVLSFLLRTCPLSRLLSDEHYTALMYRIKMGTALNLRDPKLFTEKLQWLKLNDHRKEYSMMADKYKVKAYVARLIGQEYIIPTIGVWDSFEEIDFDTLPNRFVLKCTHDSGGYSICKDKARWDKKEEGRRLKKRLKRNYYYSCRERHYKYIKPRLIAEEYLEEKGGGIKDYKVFCFDGIPRAIAVYSDRGIGFTRYFFDTDWKLLEVYSKYEKKVSKKPPQKPGKLDELLELSKKLSKGYPHLRVDFYIVDDRIYFGEITLYTTSGYTQFDDVTLNAKMGEWLKLPKNGR